MDEPTLQRQLDSIERRQPLALLLMRQSLALSLILLAYALGGVWFLVKAFDAVTVWHAGLGILLFALVTSMGGLYRRRSARRHSQ